MILSFADWGAVYQHGATIIFSGLFIAEAART